MSDLITKALLCGLGLASLTKDAIQRTAQDLVDKSTISEQEGRKLVKDLNRRATHARKALDARIEEAVHKALKNLDLTGTSGRPKSTKTSGKRSGKGRTRRRSRKVGGR